MKLWIDDERPAPDATWTIARTSEQAMRILRSSYATMVGMGEGEGFTPTEMVYEISFDHDLGYMGFDDPDTGKMRQEDDTTRRILLWIIEYNFWPQKLSVHSGNRVGAEWLEAMIFRYAPEGAELTFPTNRYRF